MGYTHYWYREKTIDKATFKKIVDDFKKVLPVILDLGIKLADGHGEGKPIINDNEIIFNGDAHCGHKQFDLGITWPAKKAKGTCQANDPKHAIKGSWFAGAKLNSRCCGGDCSHETFYFPRDLGKDAHPLPRLMYKDSNGNDVERESNEVGKYFGFTKTAYKPYDLAVNIALIIIKHYLGDKVVVASDGELEHWSDSIEITQTILGYGKDFKIDR